MARQMQPLNVHSDWVRSGSVQSKILFLQSYLIDAQDYKAARPIGYKITYVQVHSSIVSLSHSLTCSLETWPLLIPPQYERVVLLQTTTTRVCCCWLSLTHSAAASNSLTIYIDSISATKPYKPFMADQQLCPVSCVCVFCVIQITALPLPHACVCVSRVDEIKCWQSIKLSFLDPAYDLVISLCVRG